MHIQYNFTRVEFLGKLKHLIGDIDTAIEIGTQEGDYAHHICSSLDPKNFYAVDPFLLYEGYTDIPDFQYYTSQENLDVLYNIANTNISGMLPDGRSKLIRDMSCNVSENFADNSLDFVYIDADHKYDSVLADIRAWWPKIKSGGILCGDDYTDSGVEEFGVIPAVNDFATANKLKFGLTTGINPSWVFAKDNQELLSLLAKQ